jgi:hypothetical protein
MTKLITAEEARQMRDISLINFRNNGMEKYIKYLNKKIKETSERGSFGFDLWIEYYSGITPDPVISELSPVQMQQLIFHLVKNGYRAYVDRAKFYVYWNIVVQPEPEPVKEEQKNPWYMFWRKS